MARIFISYSRTDKGPVDELADQLTSAGHAVFVDRKGILTGDNWRRRLAQEIVAANVLLVTLSPVSVTSDQVEKEVELALEREGTPVRVLPVVIKKIFGLGELSYHLSGIHYVDLVSNREAGMKELGPRFLQTTPAPTKATPAPDYMFTEFVRRDLEEIVHLTLHQASREPDQKRKEMLHKLLERLRAWANIAERSPEEMVVLQGLGDTVIHVLEMFDAPLDGLRPVEIHREFMTAAARWMMALKLMSVLSARMAMRLNSLSLQKKFSIR